MRTGHERGISEETALISTDFLTTGRFSPLIFADENRAIHFSALFLSLDLPFFPFSFPLSPFLLLFTILLRLSKCLYSTQARLTICNKEFFRY